jgi:hypothetical protein
MATTTAKIKQTNRVETNTPLLVFILILLMSQRRI